MSIYLYLSNDKIFLVGIVGRMPNMPFSVTEKGIHIFSVRAKSAGSHGQSETLLRLLNYIVDCWLVVIEIKCC